jgi:hypothetical protein
MRAPREEPAASPNSMLQVRYLADILVCTYFAFEHKNKPQPSQKVNLRAPPPPNYPK